MPNLDAQAFRHADPFFWNEGLAPDLLADLADLARKTGVVNLHTWGIVLREENTPIIVEVPIDTARAVLVVQLDRERVRTDHKAYLINVPAGMVMWENGINGETIRQLIERHDADLRARGLINDAGERIKNNWLSVDEVFPKGQRRMITSLEETGTIPTVHALFAQTERLCIVGDPFGGDGLCRLDERTSVERMTSIARRIFAARGISSNRQLKGLPLTHLQLLTQQVLTELERLNSQLN